MTAVAQARAITPSVDSELATLIDKAAAAQSLDVPKKDFIAAVVEVAEHATRGYRAGLQLTRALERLERSVGQYQEWEARDEAKA
jgi:hypothetical protein